MPQAKEFIKEELEPDEIKTIQIGLGEMRETKRNKDYVSKPIYIIQNGKTVARIGYYEINKDDMSGEELLPEDMYDPLMFMYEGIKKYLEPTQIRESTKVLDEKINEPPIESIQKEVTK